MTHFSQIDDFFLGVIGGPSKLKIEVKLLSMMLLTWVG